MKHPRNTPRLAVSTLFTLGYAVMLGAGLACLLRLLGMVMAVSLDSSVLREYPRFLPFCLLLGLGALIGLELLFAFNLKAAERAGYTKRTWYVQTVIVLLLALPAAWHWTALFTLLQFML